jgi:hypothetical protein
MSLVLDFGPGSAIVAGSDGDRVELVMDAAAPPGMSLRGTLRGEAIGCTIKVLRCRREADSPVPRFRVEGRFVDLPRAQRQRVQAALARRGEEPRDPE